MLKIRHNQSNCCSFCKIEKGVTQTIHRISYGRSETTSARTLADKLPSTHEHTKRNEGKNP